MVFSLGLLPATHTISTTLTTCCSPLIMIFPKNLWIFSARRADRALWRWIFFLKNLHGILGVFGDWRKPSKMITFLGTNSIPCSKSILKMIFMIFLFQRWDTLVSWRVFLFWKFHHFPGFYLMILWYVNLMMIYPPGNESISRWKVIFWRWFSFSNCGIR